MSSVIEESARRSTSEMRVSSTSSITARAKRSSGSAVVPTSQSPFIRKWTTRVSPLSRWRSWCFPRRSMFSIRFPFAARDFAGDNLRLSAGWIALTDAIVFPRAARASCCAAFSTSGSSGIQPVVGILCEHPSDGDPECVVVVLERIQQLYAGELSRVIRAEGHHRKTGYDEPLKADLQFDHLLR